MVQARIDALHAADPNNTLPIPSDLVTASGSGLDPDISVASALYQLHRVALARNMSESVVAGLIDANTRTGSSASWGRRRSMCSISIWPSTTFRPSREGSHSINLHFASIPSIDDRVLGHDAHQLGIHRRLFRPTGGVGLLDQQADHQRLRGNARAHFPERSVRSNPTYTVQRRWTNGAWTGRSTPWRC